jgi:hypothetical protein
MGPRACGQQRSITVPNGQPNLQLDDRIGRNRAAVPYMAARGQGSRGVTVGCHSLTVTGGTAVYEPTHQCRHVKTTLS